MICKNNIAINNYHQIKIVDYDLNRLSINIINKLPNNLTIDTHLYGWETAQNKIDYSIIDIIEGDKIIREIDFGITYN